jgi:hypothetical protein
MVWAVQNVIEPKDMIKFKVLLPEGSQLRVGSDTSTKNGEGVKK